MIKKTTRVTSVVISQLGTAFVICEFLSTEKKNKVTLDLKAGKVPVWTEMQNDGKTLYFMRQPAPSFRASIERLAFAPFLPLPSLHPDWQPAIVSTGIPFAIVPLNSEKDVQTLQPSLEEISRFSQSFSVTGILFFAQKKESQEPEFAVRVFVPEVGLGHFTRLRRLDCDLQWGDV